MALRSLSQFAIDLKFYVSCINDRFFSFAVKLCTRIVDSDYVTNIGRGRTAKRIFHGRFFIYFLVSTSLRKVF